MITTLHEKFLTMESETSTSTYPTFFGENALVKMLRDTYNSYSHKRGSLGLSNPGTIEKLRREVDSDVFLSKFMFTGLKAEISRPFSMSPMFQYSHSFALGSQMPPYGFTALLGTSGVRRIPCDQSLRSADSSKDVHAGKH